MHENRETSGAPRSSQSRGRSEKAQSRTSDMHALEESDRIIVPMNQPNKEGQPSAEVGEGRVRAKENIAQSNTSPTHGRKPTCSHVGGDGADRLNTITEFSQLSDHASGAVALGFHADRRSTFFVVYALVQNLPDQSAEAMGNRPDGFLIGEPCPQTAKHPLKHAAFRLYRRMVENPPAHTLVAMAPTGSTR